MQSLMCFTQASDAEGKYYNDKDDENSDEKDDENNAQATSEGCEDSYLEVARPRRSHHHWENRFQNHDNAYQDFSLSPTKLTGRIDQDFGAQNNSESQDRLDISAIREGRGKQIILFNTFLKTFPVRISSLPCLHITATGMCFGGDNHTWFNIRINDADTASKCSGYAPPYDNCCVNSASSVCCFQLH